MQQLIIHFEWIRVRWFMKELREAAKKATKKKYFFWSPQKIPLKNVDTKLLLEGGGGRWGGGGGKILVAASLTVSVYLKRCHLL